MQKGISKIEVTAILAILIVAMTMLFIFITTRKNNNAQVSPTTTPQYTLPPTEQPTTTPFVTSTPQPTVQPTAYPTPKPSASGIRGVATLKSCVSGSCMTDPVAQMKIEVKTTSGSLVTTVYTDASGNFAINLDPGSYIVGPFIEPKSSATVAQATIKVNKSYFSQVNVKFESNI